MHRTILRDLHHSPHLPSPTLLVVGEVVNLADVPTVFEEAVIQNDDWLPAEIAQVFHVQLPRLGAEEPAP